MASTEEEDKVGNLAFSKWKYKHYFTIVERKGKNLYLKCTLCSGGKRLSTSAASNSNLMKHLTTTHAATKLVAKNTDDSNNTSVASSSKEGHDGATAAKQQKLDFDLPQKPTVTQRELNGLIGRYVVENILPIKTVESDSFKAIIKKIPVRENVKIPCRKTFSKYLDDEYANMHRELLKAFEEIEYVSTTADIWTAHNKSYLGVTAHWIHPPSLKRKKAALACRRFMGRHTYDIIATELDDIHSSFGISHKITATVTDNGSNFVKAFKVYQPIEDDECEDDEDGADDVSFVDVDNVLQNRGDDVDDVDDAVMVTLPPHHRCASHTLNLVSCTDVEKWLQSSDVKSTYRSATAKCTALWNKASRSTVAAETVDEVLKKKLLVPCSTRWNSFYDAVARICEIPITELTTLSSKFGVKAITERELLLLKEYCKVMKPLTVALDKLQGEDRCFHGTLLPTLESMISQTLDPENTGGLQILVHLPAAVVMVRNSLLTLNMFLHFEKSYIKWIFRDRKSTRLNSSHRL